MLPARLWRNTPVRVGFLFTTLFLTVLVIAGAVTYFSIQDELEDRLDARVLEEFTELQVEYEEEGQDTLIAEIGEEITTSSKGSESLVFALISKHGDLLAGQPGILPLAPGFHTIEIDGVRDEDSWFRIKVDVIDGLQLAVGINMRDIEEVREILVANLLTAAVAIILLALAGTILLTRRFQTRFDGLRAALQSVSKGDWNARLPVSSSKDDIDDFAQSINETLSRLQGLMEAIRQVSADIAHDLKTPLGRLFIATEEALSVLEKGNDPTSYLQEINNEARTINTTFEGLLSISQIEGGAKKERFQGVDLLDLARSIVEIYSAVAEDEGFCLNLKRPAEARYLVTGDRDLLNNLLANLVENAMRHCPGGSVIEIGLSSRDRAVLLSVADNGPGIPAEERDKVLRRLYRLEKSRTTPGSGLGLALVKAISDLHGGTLSLADNEPGLRVSLTLPIADRDQA
ncbi:MAG: HAMP domain-containing sensor histidine kinase [Ahrensia sp.]|nr:HAMP domain-containing sensor histidine kinase [Ahrensia sp.]